MTGGGQGRVRAQTHDWGHSTMDVYEPDVHYFIKMGEDGIKPLACNVAQLHGTTRGQATTPSPRLLEARHTGSSMQNAHELEPASFLGTRVLHALTMRMSRRVTPTGLTQ